MAPSTTARILVVDDDDDLRAVAKMTLEVLGGFRVDTAAGGEACLALARQRRPDLIVLDVRMPGMDGPTTFRALAADPATRGVPVVFLTGTERGRARRTRSTTSPTAV